MGAPWGGPLGSKFFYHNQKHYWHLLKSVTINEQGRRNGFSKVVPWFGGLGLHGGAGGLHGGAPGVPKLLPRSKINLGHL